MNWIQDNKWKLFTALMGLIVLFICAVMIYDWSTKHKFQNPILIDVKTQPLAVKQEVKVIKPIPDEPKLPEWYLELSDLEKKIVDTFGIENGQVALAVAQAESGLSVESITPEPNGTVSIGLFQINSVHWDKYSVRDLLTVEGNIKAAKEIWEDQGWTPWTTYRNRAFVNHLE